MKNIKRITGSIIALSTALTQVPIVEVMAYSTGYSTKAKESTWGKYWQGDYSESPSAIDLNTAPFSPVMSYYGSRQTIVPVQKEMRVGIEGSKFVVNSTTNGKKPSIVIEVTDDFKFNEDMVSVKELSQSGIRKKLLLTFDKKTTLNAFGALMIGKDIQSGGVGGLNIIRLGDFFATINNIYYAETYKTVSVMTTIKPEISQSCPFYSSENDKTIYSETPVLTFEKNFTKYNTPHIEINGSPVYPDKEGRVILDFPITNYKTDFSIVWEKDQKIYRDSNHSVLFDSGAPTVELATEIGKNEQTSEYYISGNRKITLKGSDDSGKCTIYVEHNGSRIKNQSTAVNTFTFVAPKDSTGRNLDLEGYTVTAIDSVGHETSKPLKEIDTRLSGKVVVEESNVSIIVKVDGVVNGFGSKGSIINFDVKGINTQIKDVQVAIGAKPISVEKTGDTTYAIRGVETFYPQEGVVSVPINLMVTKDTGVDTIVVEKNIKYDFEAPDIVNANLQDTKTIKETDNLVYFRQGNKLYIKATDKSGSGIDSITLLAKRHGSTEEPKEQVVYKTENWFTLDGSDGERYEYTIVVKDKRGNETRKTLGELLGNKGYNLIKFDKNGPQIAIDVSKETPTITGEEDREFITEDANIYISVMDKDNEIANVKISENDNLIYDGKNPTYTYQLTHQGKTVLKVEAEDESGNVSALERTLYNDQSAPYITDGEFLNYNPDYAIGDIAIFNKQVQFRFHARDNEDGSGIQSTVVNVDDKRLTPNKGIYTLTTKPAQLKIELEDICKNKAIYNLGDVKGLKHLDKILIDNDVPAIECLEPEGKFDGDWYSSDKVFIFTAKDKTALRDLTITVNGEEFTRVENDNQVKTELTAEFDTRNIEFENEDGYEIVVTTTDMVGNQVSKTVHARIDRTDPEIKKFIFEGKDGVQEGKNINGEDRYGFFFNGEARVTIEAVDEGMSSGLNKVHYTLFDKDGNVFDDGKGEATFKDGYAIVELPNDFKGFIEAEPVDNVGHIGMKNKPDGFANSNTTLNANIIDINLPDSEHKDNKGLTLYPKDVKGQIVIHPNEYGWKTVKWGTTINGVEKVYGDVNIDKNGFNFGTDVDIKERDRNLVLDMRSMLNVKDNENNITVWVQVVDKRGQTSYKQATFSIDKDAPLIKIDYDQNNANGMYAQARKATITISERNFRAKDVNIGGNNTGISSWVDLNDTIHQCVVSFDKDDDYQLTVDYEDLAGNRADSYISEKFTVDTTLPVMTVNFDNNNSLNGMYYDASRTATVKIVEHNFDPKKINITGEGMLGEWHTDGDVHVNTILFGRDGEYSFTIDGEDKAGNKVQPYQSESFVIDMTTPTIAIEGIEDGVSHKGNVSIRVAVGDNYLDQNNTSVVLESRKRGAIDMIANLNSTTGTFVLENMPKEQEWDDGYLLSVVVTDKAGNRTARELSFTVNRFGSQYDVQQGDIMGKPTAVLPAEFVFTESSVDRIDMTKTTVDINRNGEEYKYDSTLLQKDEKKTAEGYEYKYTLKTTAFVDDGKYNVGVVSIADDGTKNASAKNNFSFIYDTTAPKVSISGIESGMSYVEESHDVAVDFDDLSGVEESSIYVNGDMIDPDATEAYQKFTLPQSSDTYTVVVEARDLAGNETRSEIQGVRVSNSWFDVLKSYANSYLSVIIPIFAVLVAVGIITHTYFKRKRQDDAIRRENLDD